jgi:hypothetical protein
MEEKLLYMRKLWFALFLAQASVSCAVLDGYKNNQHSEYAKRLTPEAKASLAAGEELVWEFNSASTKGKLLVTKENAKFGKYNFIEIDEWEEHFDYETNGIKKGKAKTKTTYDQYGNVVFRTEWIKPARDSDFYQSTVIDGKLLYNGTDSVFVQTTTILNKYGQKTTQYSNQVINYKELLSDRLKNKKKAGSEYIYDETGKIKRIKEY